MRTQIKEYLVCLDDLTGDAEPSFYPFQELNDQDPIYMIAYQGIPDPGHLTGFTFGISDVARTEWLSSRPELIISVKSVDYSWLLAVGELAAKLQRTSLFAYGTILDFQETISDESEMSAFLIFSNSLLDEDESSVTLDDRKIWWSQAYPIYASEIEIIQKIGSEKFFFGHDIDFFDVKRDPFVLK